MYSRSLHESGISNYKGTPRGAEEPEYITLVRVEYHWEDHGSKELKSNISIVRCTCNVSPNVVTDVEIFMSTESLWS